MNKKTNLNFLRLSLLGIILITSIFCGAENEDKNEKRPEGSDPSSRAISPKKEYTKDEPAEWKAIAKDHIPEIVFNSAKSKDNIKVTVLGKNFSERHYIEVIGIMDERSADIDVKYLKRGDNPAVMLSLDTKEYDPEKIKVFAKCNLHDLWTLPLIPLPE
jgi:desulfoferrodoxin (superoxide reductase-like protein)